MRIRLTLLLTILALVIGITTIRQRVQASQAAGHLLVLASDASDFGETVTTIDDRIKINNGTDDYGVFRGWSEVRYTSFGVINDKAAISVDSASYRFSSEVVADKSLVAATSQEGNSEVSIVIEKQILNEQTQHNLNKLSASWVAWQGTDNEGLVIYTLWLREGNYIREIHITSLPETQKLAKELFNHLSNVIASKPDRYMSLFVPQQQPDGYISMQAYAIDLVWGWHYLALWSRPNGYAPHYHGPGGDAETCGGEHGCIGTWSWWTPAPPAQSRLGITKTFYLTHMYDGAATPSNYSATVWMD